ncbi:Gfo/Idh/MocA family protein [Cohnella hashimotonis]|uniref:Gfo/Idh/MocA family oxidoreductase n=1 Tax=Cohnella hashimotonis TaxID=2826895 RepID=A0ABT6T9S2_9BACL|nr:Gfo/Idh/MocA family oxidoreductase [Cohnella hashimotonis]MDI4643571.1 Gfo/Idh/MocA family oxidoreductase [Cohnella hashimotonis]
MKRKLRWGIAGCAGIAVNAVMPAIQSSETGVIAAVASRDISKAKAAADKFGIDRAYGSYEELMEDPDIDAVYIPLPNHLHREWTIRAAEAGKHVLCEKPLALTAREAAEMAEACARSGVHLAEAFMYRHHPRIGQIRHIVGSGEIGSLRALNGAFTFNNASDAANIRYRSDWGGGSLYDVGCYPLSAARLIVGREPEAVTVHAMFSPEHDNVDMMASGLVEFSDGIALTFDCGMWAAFRQTLEIVGTDGRIFVPHAFLTGADNAGFEVHGTGGSRIVQADGVNAYRLEVDDFASVVAGEKEPAFPADDALRNMRLLEACLQSARRRERITLV